MGRPITKPDRATPAQRAKCNALAKARYEVFSVKKAKSVAKEKLDLADKIERGVKDCIDKILSVKGGIKGYQIKELVAVARVLRRDAEEVLLKPKGERIPDDLADAARKAGVLTGPFGGASGSKQSQSA